MRRLLFEVRHALDSPSRHPRFAVVVGRLLGAAFVLCFATGLFSHFLQNPIPGMVFPTSPASLYAWTQGTHVAAGIACFPLLLAKLYVVYPRLFVYPPVKGPLDLLERASIALFVASSLLQIAIGLVNTYEWYPWPFPFRQVHYALAFVIIGSLAIHIAFKLPLITQYWRKRTSYDALGELVPPREEGREKDEGPSGPPLPGITGRVTRWIDETPQPRPAIARRGFLIATFAGVAGVVGLTAGQSFRILDAVNVFGPRVAGVGPGGLPVNRSAKEASITPEAVGADWRLVVTRGDRERAFSLPELTAMRQTEVDLPIACVDGWSQMAHWEGVRLHDLLDAVGARHGESIRITSVERSGPERQTHMTPEFIADDRTLVALRLSGEVLDLDHGYPARIIAPGRPGALQTKWLGTIEVIDA